MQLRLKPNCQSLNHKTGKHISHEYATLSRNWWQKLGQYRNLTIECSKDATVLKKLVEKARAYQFMIVPNEEYDQVRVQILIKEEMSSLNEIMFLVSAEKVEDKLYLNLAPLIAPQWQLKTLNHVNRRSSQVTTRTQLLAGKTGTISSVSSARNLGTPMKSVGNFMISLDW